MQTSPVLTTVTVGNHLRTAAETAAGVPQRDPFLDEDGVPVDPDAVTLALTAPTGTTRTFAWPAAGPTDAGALTQQATGRFFVAWAPADGEDGLWRWSLLGAMDLGTGYSDQDVFYVQRPIAPGP